MPRFKLDFKSFPSFLHNVQPVQLYIHISKMKIRIAGWEQKRELEKYALWYY